MFYGLSVMKDIIVLDGGMGRELARRGAPFRQPEWSALALTEAPDAVREVHLDYIRAGAGVITTNSYAVVPFHIGERFAAEAETLAATAGRLAREAADRALGLGPTMAPSPAPASPAPQGTAHAPGSAAQAARPPAQDKADRGDRKTPPAADRAGSPPTARTVKVAGSLPPPFGSYRPDLFDADKAPAIAQPLVRGLAPHVDIWLAETQSSIAEPTFWKTQLPADGKPFWVSFTLEDTSPHDVPVLRSGETVADAVNAMLKLGAAAVMFNCSQPEVMEAAVKVARAELDRAGSPARLGVYANAFEASHGEMRAANDGLDEIRKDTTPPNYLRWAQDWVNAGADMVGGCCGIGPEHIAELSAKLRPSTPRQT